LKRILYALTGRPGCGKTTAALRVADSLKRLGVAVDGMYTEEMREAGRRVGFIVKRISTDERGVLARAGLRSRFRVGRYGVNLSELERVGVRAIREGIERAEFIVVDEVGPMELYSRKFREAVSALLESRVHALLTVHFRSQHPLVKEVKKAAGRNLIILNRENRDRVPGKIVREISEALGRV